MINVNQITSQLAKLPDQALQQYAMMHKNDPYVVSLALAESNRRKEIRGGAQMQQQPQPTVADQAIQGMAPAPAPMAQPPMAQSPMPENVGIGQLPAGNMSFAGGGIVAFADGGETADDYMYPPGEVVARMAGGGAVPRYNEEGLVRYPGMLSMEGGTVLPTTSGYEGLGILEFLQKFGGDVGGKLKKLIRSEEENAARMYGGRTADIYEARRKRGPDPFSEPDLPMPVSTASAAPVVYGGNTGKTMPTVPSIDTLSAGDRRTPSPAVTGAGTAAGSAMPTTMGGVADLFKTMRGQFDAEMPASQKDLLQDIANTAQTQAEENLKTIELQQAARGKYGEEQEKRLKAREERINREESNLFGTSLFQAGLAIMGGTSPHGMVNIAAGAQVGLKNYQMGMDKLSAARDKLDDAFGRLEDIRRSEGIMYDKERNAAMADVQKAVLQGKKDLYTANHEYFKMSREDANKAADAYLRVLQSEYEQGEQTKRTNIMAGAQNALPGEIRAAMLLGTGATETEKLQTGLPALMGLKDRMTDSKIADLYQKHVTDAAKNMQTPMTPEAFAKAVKQAVGAFRPEVVDTGAGQSSGSVYNRP